MRKKFKKFWREWGITWEEFGTFLGACSMILIPILLNITLSIIK